MSKMCETDCTQPNDTFQSELSLFMTRKLSNTYSNRRAQEECQRAADDLRAAKLMAPPPRRKEKSTLLRGIDLKDAELKKTFVQTYVSGKAAK
ncbi:MAG: hypothetical protein C0507_00450 [Cyanobacteria bacterium PR.3.49]|nr:hypothetical protein [Cyanobacteria bacterium PR.3.49]